MPPPFPARARAFLQTEHFMPAATGESGAHDAKFDVLTNEL
jgi:hypothetical protein